MVKGLKNRKIIKFGLFWSGVPLSNIVSREESKKILVPKKE